MYNLLKILSEANGVSGNENEVRDIIKTEAAKFASVSVDRAGNVIAHKKGRRGAKKIMICAHMDEVGFMVSSVDDNGFIKFKPVGGIDERVLLSKKVVIGHEKIKGVIGVKAIHLQSVAERKKNLPMNSLYIDVGALSKQDSGVSVGDYISFDTEFCKFGDNKIKGKALDDRLGCSALLEILKDEYDNDIYAAFTVQEEIGMRGAYAAAYNINPDEAIVCEGTTAADVPESNGGGIVTTLGKGAAVSFMDGASIVNRDLFARIVGVCDERQINYQFKEGTFGGNDAGAIHLSREGIPTVSISVPCRYIHSPVSVADLGDYKSMIDIVKAYLNSKN